LAVTPAAGHRPSAKALGWTRLAVAVLVIAAGVWLQNATHTPIHLPLFALAAAGIAVSSVILLLGPPAVTESRRFAWLQVSLDAVLVTAIVATSGGPQSFFTFLYVLTVIEACLLLSRAGALTVAGLSSVLYIGLVLAKTILPLYELIEPTETTALEVLTVFTNAGMLVVLAIVAGSLAERYAGAQRDLETQHRHLSDVRAFRDLIFESVGTGLVGVSLDGRITAFNRAAEAITGITTAEALGGTWASIFGPELDIDEIRSAVAAPGVQSPRHEIHLTRRDGREIPVGVSFWELRSGDGAAVGLIGVCQDLSSIKQLEQRMRQADRLAAVGRLSANIAHEIRNPLASVSGAIEALAKELPPDATRGRLVEIVLRESQRLNQLITEFLDYARPAPMTLVEVDMATLLEEVIVLLEHRRLPDGLKVAREISAPLPARADPQQLRQAIWNLCLNAVQAMPEGGELRVGGRPLSLASGQSRLELWIADTGAGIAESDLPHVFEPFYSTKPGGTGLGLAAVYRIVQDHGGHIEVRSRAGQGTTMIIGLPARSPSGGASRSAG
jgi:two-component system sensor histidine kinase PilS (NtrC family)